VKDPSIWKYSLSPLAQGRGLKPGVILIGAILAGASPLAQGRGLKPGSWGY